MTALLEFYRRWNRNILRILWVLTAIGLVASLPMIMNRVEMENSSKRVEFVFDYRGLLEVSEYQTNPAEFVDEQLAHLQEAGVNGVAVYESTLKSLELTGDIKLYSAEDAALLSGDDDMQRSNKTYVLFNDKAATEALEPIIRDGFALFDIAVGDWSYNGKHGLAIDTGKLSAEILPLDPNPRALAKLHEQGFLLSARLSDSRPYDHQRMDELLGRLKAAGVDSIIFAGKQVTGYSEDRNKLALTSMGELIRKHNLQLAVIEMTIDKQQKGFNKLAYLADYPVVRLHSILEEEVFTDAPVLADRYVLAVKDRNFRMIYLNAKVKVDKEKGLVMSPIHNLIVSLKDPEFGAIKRIEEMGYTIGRPEPFEQVTPGWEKPLKLLVILGGIALVARMLGYFARGATLLFFLVGLVGSAGLLVLNSTLFSQALALLVGIAAPVVAIITAVRAAGRRVDAGGLGSGAAFGVGLALFARTVLLSLVGAVYIVALLNNVTYLLVLNQYRGVSVLHTVPILLTAVYLAFFFRAESLGEVVRRGRAFLLANIRVVWVFAALVGGAVFVYYLTRTGNQGVVMPWDRAFRSLLENTMGVRPRTKELLTHPLMIMGLFLMLRYGRSAVGGFALALVAIGSMAMLSVVDTFAHLHTPLWVSSLRVLYGAIISVGIALIYYAAWELLVRGWKLCRKWIEAASE